jgi:light-harvesting complex 1 beta chain
VRRRLASPENPGASRSLQLRVRPSPGAHVFAAGSIRRDPRRAGWRGTGPTASTEVPFMADLDRKGSLSGLSEHEAKEFHRIFIASFIVFTLIAIVAHILVWNWRPWIPGPNGYTSSILDTARTFASYIPYAFTA